MMAAVFWISVAGVAYPYFGFPLLLWCLGKIIKRPALTSDPGFAPSISLIIPVHNEDSRISRPRQIYTGETLRSYQPIAERR